MKFYFKHPSGWEISFHREPLERDKFFALVGLAAGALVVVWFLGSIALR